MSDKYLKPIADGGSDAASGNSLANAYGTLAFALGAMAQDDRLLVKGTHTTSNTSFANVKSGSGSGTYTQIEAIDYGVSTFLGGTSGHNVVMYPDSKSWISMKGFVLDGNVGRLSSYGITGSTTHSTSTPQGQNLLFEDMQITRVIVVGIKLHASNCILRRFLIHDVGRTDIKQGHGMYIGADDSDNLFEDFELYNCSDFGIQNQSSGAGAAALGNTYKRFHSHHNGSVGFWLGHEGDLDNLITHDNGSAGLILSPDSGRTATAVFIAAYNNGLAGSATGLITKGAGTCVMRNYIALDNVNGNYSDVAGGTRTLSNGLTTGSGTTYWQDPASADFHLNAGEPTTSDVVGQGVAVSGVTLDFDQVTRTDPPDIGPYQREGAGAGGATNPVNVIPLSLTTPINTALEFESFSVSHGGDLDEVILYTEEGSFS